MKILVLNGGSSSHKLSLFCFSNDSVVLPKKPIWEQQIEWMQSFDQARLSKVLRSLWTGNNSILKSHAEIGVVGHRIVHGGHYYQTSVVITSEVKDTIEKLIPLAPIHNPINLIGIELIEQIIGKVPQVAVFDTAFHCQIPESAAIYPGPYEWVKQGIRRYGFHGISHQYCTKRAGELLRRDLSQLKLIICHLGNGASLSAVKGGKSINTTMGFTPLDGMMMGTRSGAIDPGILLHLMRQGYTIKQMEEIINKKSGLLGISGISHDLRKVEQAIKGGNIRAKLARDIYIHRLNECLGEMIMSLGGVDAIVFTGGVGEHSATVRAIACESLAFLGLELDRLQNESSPIDQDIATSDSRIRVLVIRTQEDWAIARDCWRQVQ